MAAARSTPHQRVASARRWCPQRQQPAELQRRANALTYVRFERIVTFWFTAGIPPRVALPKLFSRANRGTPNVRLAHNLSYNYVRFERSTGEKFFTVHIVNLRNTYQFTPRFFIRAIAQFDSAKRVFGDFLASYELMPGTVAHAGYGSILESINGGRYTATARALFFKV